MSKAIYIASNEPYSGKSMLTLGLMHFLLQSRPKVAYFRPIIDDSKDREMDNHITTVLNHFDLNHSYEDAYALKRSELIKKLNKDQEDEVINVIIEKYKFLEEQFDFIIVEGSDFSDHVAAIQMDLNILIAKNLNIPVIIVNSGTNKTMEGFIEGMQLAYDSFEDKEIEVLAVVANKVQPENLEAVKLSMAKVLPNAVSVNAIPLNNKLHNPTLKEIVDATGAKVHFGEDHLNNITGEMKIGAMSLANFLNHLTEDCLVITPSDRSDLLLGALQANISSNYPSISGLILTGGFELSQSVNKLINGLEKIVPVLMVEGSTFKTASQLNNVRSHIYNESKSKIKMSLDIFENYMDLDINKFNERLSSSKGSDLMTPRMFQYNLLKQAKTQRKHIVLPEGNDDRILTAAALLQQQDILDLTILGKRVLIEAAIKRLNLNFDLEKTSIIDPVNSSYFEEFSQTLYALRKHKGVSPAMAEDLMADVSYFGTMMVYKGLADGMVSGAAHTTQHTIRPALQFVKTKPGFSVVSSIFFMCLEDRVSVFGDCAINPNPTAEELAEIAISSADSGFAFGLDPKVALLSYSSGSSGKGEDVDRVREATAIVRAKRPDLKAEGPIQYDAAVDKEVGAKKLPGSDVAGQANILIFPDLNTGNNTYKAVQRETGALAIGPMLQGLNKPVNDLSRGCTVDDIYNTVIITAIQAQQ